MADVTRLLDVIKRGDPQAAADLLPPRVRRTPGPAARQLARQTPDATARVHAAYLRPVGDRQFASRRHSYAAAHPNIGQ